MKHDWFFSFSIKNIYFYYGSTVNILNFQHQAVKKNALATCVDPDHTAVFQILFH